MSSVAAHPGGTAREPMTGNDMGFAVVVDVGTRDKVSSDPRVDSGGMTTNYERINRQWKETCRSYA